MIDMAAATGRAHDHAVVSPLRLIIRAARVGLLFLLALLVAPLSLVIGKQRAAGITYWWYGRLLRALGIELHIHGTVPQTPVLIVANHSSWLDIVTLGHVFGAAFISKAEVAGWPLIGAYARITDTVFLARGAYRTDSARAQIQARFARHRSVVLFAEGTTSDTPAPQRFHARLFAVALDGGHTVLPVALRYADAATPGDAHHPAVPWQQTSLRVNFMRILRLSGLRAEVRVCDMIAPDGHTRRSLAEASRHAIAEQTRPAATTADPEGG